MSVGRIMTLSVESLHKLYSQFLQTHVLPLLTTPPTELTHLLRQKSAYETHRYLQQLLAPKTADNHSHQNNTSQNGSLTHLPERTSAYQYALATSPDQHKTDKHSSSRNFNRSTEKAHEEKKDNNGKMALRRTLTAYGYQDRSQPQHNKEQIFSPIPSLSQSVGHDSLLPVPSLGSPSITSDFKLEVGQTRQRVGDSQGSMGDLISKGRIMKEAVSKIGKLFNENHSKIEKYSRKVDSQNKLFNLNVSTKLERKEEGKEVKVKEEGKEMKVREEGRLKDYQFHVRQDVHSRKL